LDSGLEDKAWPYAKKLYIFLGLMFLSLTICAILVKC
jgi:hypothetical protein